MISKLAAIIFAGALVGVALLTVRQQRLHAVYQMTEALEAASARDRELWRVRIEIARTTSIDSTRSLCEEIGPMLPMPMEWNAPRPIELAELSMEFAGVVRQ